MTPIRRAVLGATDHEMEAIRRLLTAAGIPCVEATSPGREAARLAYESAVRPEEGDLWIECAPRAMVPFAESCSCGGAGCALCEGGKELVRARGGVVIDHHHPGDPGFGRASADAFEASSLGQVWALIGPTVHECGWCSAGAAACVDGLCGQCGGAFVPVRLAPGETTRCTGAADHALAAFAWGNAGVQADVARAFLAARAGVPEEDVEEATQLLADAPWLGREGEDWRTMRRLLGPCATSGWIPHVADIRDIPELAPGGRLGKALVTAAITSGFAYVGWGTQGLTAQGRHVSFGGAGEGSIPGVLPMTEILTALGCVGVYGDPVRGVGGGYLPVTA